ncbi:hypothetical protein HY621_00355 [Candidatus Uhrbacteria bacterium]|nr:hypothetical protein [Candidatus Uhrbacteria bacterium]
MPIIYSAIVPHSPIFLPSLRQTAQEKVASTIHAFTEIHARITELNPDTIFVVAPHDESKKREEQYTFHVPEHYVVDFSEFGDIVTKTEYDSDIVLANQIKDKLTQEGIGVTYVSDEKLDYSAGVPLEHIAKGLHAKVLVIHPPSKDLALIFSDGSQIQKILQESQKRIVCIASADLSHCLIEDAPLAFNQSGVALDANIVQWISTKRTKNFLTISLQLIEEVGACGIPSIVLLLGILKHIKHTPTLLSYEDAVGVGHAVAEYTIS